MNRLRQAISLGGVVAVALVLVAPLISENGATAQGRVLADWEMARLVGDAPDTTEDLTPCVQDGKCIDKFPGKVTIKNVQYDACFKCDDDEGKDKAKDPRSYCCVTSQPITKPCQQNGTKACPDLLFWYATSFTSNGDACSTCSATGFWDSQLVPCSWINATGDPCPK